ncbi:hypothetical protein, partial [Streptantibioticus silvisoli]
NLIHEPEESDPMDGVSTYLALTFSTLLSSQGTEATFETVSPAAPGFPFGVPPAYQILSGLIPAGGDFAFVPCGTSTTLVDFLADS